MLNRTFTDAMTMREKKIKTTSPARFNERVQFSKEHKLYLDDKPPMILNL